MKTHRGHLVMYSKVFFYWRYNPLWVCILQPSSGLQPPRLRGFQITHNDAPQSVGLLWTSDPSVAETSTWQHTTLTTDKHPCPRWDSNPQSQQASGRRPTPSTRRPLGPAPVSLCMSIIRSRPELGPMTLKRFLQFIGEPQNFRGKYISLSNIQECKSFCFSSLLCYYSNPCTRA